MNLRIAFLPILITPFTFACNEGQSDPSAASKAGPSPDTKPSIPVEALY